MPIVARTRFVAGRAVCDVRTYQIRRRDGAPSVRFSIGSVDGLDVSSGERTIDVIRAVRVEAERRSARSAAKRFADDLHAARLAASAADGRSA